MARDDQNPLLTPRARAPIPDPIDDPRAHAAASVADAAALDTEDHRRMLNLRRRVLQRFGRRTRYLALVTERDPALGAELEALRKLSPQAFRKRLQHEVRQLGLHQYLRHGPRELDEE